MAPFKLTHGGTEMGQGVHTNIVDDRRAANSASCREYIRVMPTSTDKVPNTSATAASCGTDLNGAAVRNGCEILRRRLALVAAGLMTRNFNKQVAPQDLEFRAGIVRVRNRPEVKIKFQEIVREAYLQRISLSAHGFYRTPGIHWDRKTGRGKPFHYFVCGAAVVETEIDGFTGMHQIIRADLLQDTGNSINEAINRGQIEGGFIQGQGWLTTEELRWDAQGRLLTHSPDTYKIPSIGDTPRDLRVSFLKNAAHKEVVLGSKAVGEPPLMLAIAVREAIRQAVAAFGNIPGEVPLASPATCEAIFRAVQSRKAAPLLVVSKDLSNARRNSQPSRRKPLAGPRLKSGTSKKR